MKAFVAVLLTVTMFNTFIIVNILNDFREEDRNMVIDLNQVVGHYANAVAAAGDFCERMADSKPAQEALIKDHDLYTKWCVFTKLVETANENTSLIHNREDEQ